tara:strand:+ start:781 stop:2145 length:1365 start_codon:yes stop_codon:yes gene_type:complete
VNDFFQIYVIMADLSDQNQLLSNEANVAVSSITPADPISSALAAVRIPGSFELQIESTLNFLQGQLGQVRDLEIRLRETARSTGNFVQLQHKAALEVTCDFRKFIAFNGSDQTDDDAYQFTGITLTNDPTKEADAQKRIADSQYLLDLKPALSDVARQGVDADKTSYDAASSVLSTVNFPVGAVLIDLDTHLSSVNAADKQITIGATGNPATYQVKADKTVIGMTLFGQLNLNCSNVNGSPALSAEASFAPAGSILGGGQHDSITINLLNQEDFTTAQDVTVNAAGATAGQNLVNLSYAAAPGQNDADDFDINISLANLGGENDAGSVGASMIAAIKSGVNSASKLVKVFTIIVTQMEFKVDSDFSGYMRELAKAPGRAQEMPILAGEKFIVQNPAHISLAVTPFQYAFTSAGYTGNIAAFNMLDNMEVYAVLKHAEAAPAPVLQSVGMAALTV